MKSIIPFIVNYSPIKKLAIIPYKKKLIKFIKLLNCNILTDILMEMDIE